MANTNSTLINTEQSRAGAMACIEALRAIENITLICDIDSMDAWWRGEDNAVAVMLQAAGKPDGFMAGFIAAIAEYVKMSHGGCPDLDKWTPEATMTDKEKEASRVGFEERMEEIVEGIEEAKDVKELTYQEASEQARNSIAELLTSAEDFKKRCASTTAKIIPIFVEPADGYSFENNTAEKIDRSITALSEIIKDGDVAFSPAMHEQLRNDLVAKAFEKYQHVWTDKADMNVYIQRFMTEQRVLVGSAASAHV